MKKLLIALVAGAASLGAHAFDENDLASGVFILNEDWYGHQNSTINMWYPNEDDPFGNIYYRVFQSKNPDREIGCTAQYAQIFGGRIYIMAKQHMDPGTHTAGGRLTVANAATMAVEKQFAVINPAGTPSTSGGSSTALGDGRGCCGVNPDKVYLGTNNGIYIYTVSSGIITGPIAGTANPLITGQEQTQDGQGPLYQNQIGMMLRTQDYVLAIQQDRGVLVIDPVTDALLREIPGCFSTMVQAADGSIWAGENLADPNKTNAHGISLAHYPYGTDGDCWDGRGLLRIDPWTLETERVTLTLPGAGIPQSWYAWTAGKLAASAKRNYLYFTYADPTAGLDTRYYDTHLFRFDTDTRECTLVYDATDDDLNFYGCSLRVGPVDDQLYCNFFVGRNIASTQWVYRRFADSGADSDALTETAAAQLIENYWYPALFVFPDNAAPVVSGMPSDIELTAGSATVALADKVTDADSPSAAIVTRITANSNPAAVSAAIVRGELVLTRGSEAGTADITVQFDSNGLTADATVAVTNPVSGLKGAAVSELTVRRMGNILTVSGIAAADGTVVEVYNAQGARVAAATASAGTARLRVPAAGILIVRTPTATAKVL